MTAEDNTATEAPRVEDALRARDPDLDAAYAILGKQHPVDTWVAVLNNLARQADLADLELVAHSTLGRPPAVIDAVLALARAKGSQQAAFLASVIARSRDEEALVRRARELISELTEEFDLDVQVAAGEAYDALFFLLTRPISEQATEVRRLTPDPAFAELTEVVRSEYERLQEVSRDTRWRTGSYRHVLRHALADVALLARPGGRLEEQAFRLLQLRTEDFSANGELLGTLDPDVRARYLKWTLERASVESSPERAVFALEELERYPRDVDRAKVSSLLSSKELIVARAAALFLVRTDPADASNDRAIAELIDAMRARGSG